MNTNRDSFDHRIDDDLFEEIISYLPIKDKFKYESVSKRFQRFVFNKQRVLKIISFEGLRNCLLTELSLFGRQINVPNLRSLPKKLRFITTIEIYENLEYMTQFVDTITDNCHHLTAFYFSYDFVESEVLKKFCLKFGQQLRHISLITYVIEEKTDILFELSPNVSHISNPKYRDMKNKYLSQKLVKINGLCLKNADQFSLLSHQKLLNLQYLEIWVRVEFKPEIDSIPELSQLKNLRVLKISVNYCCIGSDIWPKTIQSIGTNCLHLKYFQFDRYIRDKVIAKKCFEDMVHFCGLKKLYFNVSSDHWTPEEKISDLRPLKNCKNLLALDLISDAFGDNFFNEIHSIVPQLRQLSLKSINSFEMTNKALKSIANLKRLTQLEFKDNLKATITAQDIETLINGCKRLKVLRICAIIGVKDTEERNKWKDFF